MSFGSIVRLFTFLLVIETSFCSGQIGDPNLLENRQVLARDTDGNIAWELARHQTFYNPSATPKNVLLVHMVGTIDNPTSTILFPSMAANYGYHAVSLKYPNDTSATTACASSSDFNCYYKFRKEIIEGIDYSPEITVDQTNSVLNRLKKLIAYMHAQYPADGWGQYLNAGDPIWNKIMVSGHSQGGGHAALIALENQVNRVLMFASPNDYSDFYGDEADWTTLTSATADSLHFAFGATQDNIATYSEEYAQWNNMGLGAFGDTINVDIVPYPYSNSRLLYTKRDTTGLAGTHSIMLLDDKTPKDGNGDPVFEPVWKYMLGIVESSTSISENDFQSEIMIYQDPFNKSVTINKGKRVFVYNQIGKLVFESQLNGQELRLNLPSGLYVLNVVGVEAKLSRLFFLR